MQALTEQVLVQILSHCRKTKQQMKQAKGIQHQWLHKRVKFVVVCACHAFGVCFFFLVVLQSPVLTSAGKRDLM